MIITMDGPAGSGKSSLAKMLAQRVGFAFLDTGAMYRCVTLCCLRSEVDLSDEQAVASIAESILIELDGERIVLDGEDVSSLLRTPEVTRSIRPIADNHRVRSRLVSLQREWAGTRNVVTEGRDQGTVAFPNAECKIFLTASPEERARRRIAQLNSMGMAADYDDILSQQNLRDAEDTSRSVGGLKAASDAIYVHTDGMSEEAVLERLIELVRERRERLASSNVG